MSDGLLTTYWQGDVSRCSELLIGQSIAGLEIAEAVRLWVAMGEYTDTKMAQHFAFKTGMTIDYGYEFESELMMFICKAARKLGSAALISPIKTGAGMP